MEDFHAFYNKKNYDGNSILKKAKRKERQVVSGGNRFH